MELWIARDQDGELGLFTNNKPKKLRAYFIPQPYGKASYYTIDKDLFPEVTWENSPKRVRIKLVG